MRKKSNDEAVSSVLGEFLMICLVLVLVAVFGASLSNFVPEDRDPTVTFLVDSLPSDGADHAVTIWHKGGDGLMKSSITVIFTNNTNRITCDSTMITINDDVTRKGIVTGDKIVVDVGKRLAGDEMIQIATSRAVIFNGRVYRNE